MICQKDTEKYGENLSMKNSRQASLKTHHRPGVYAKARRLRLCPPDLQKVINIVNSVPAHESIPSVPLWWNWNRHFQLDEVLSWDEFRMKYWPEMEPLMFLRGPRKGQPYPVAVMEFSNSLHTLREGWDVIENIFLSRRSQTFGARIPLEVILCEMKDGRLTLETNPVVDAFTNLKEGEMDRIRQCPICKQIYWAGRIDQPACRLHAHAYRQRLYMARKDENKDDYNKARTKKRRRGREERERKKGGAEIHEEQRNKTMKQNANDHTKRNKARGGRHNGDFQTR
jgi:hypothetical protein